MSAERFSYVGSQKSSVWGGRLALLLGLLPLHMSLVGISQCDTDGDQDDDEWTVEQGDCDDDNAEVNPAAEEYCNLIDDNCDGTIDEGAVDSDGDGVVNCADDSIYMQTFDTCPEYSVIDLAGTNYQVWGCADGALTEKSNGGNSMAILGDFGQQNGLEIDTLLSVNPGSNDAIGIVVGYRDAGNYYLLQWVDPNDFEGENVSSLMYLYKVADGVSTLLQSASYAPNTLVSGIGTNVAIKIDGNNLRVNYQFETVINYTDGEVKRIGPAGIGFYSYDADTGVNFLDLNITNQ